MSIITAFAGGGTKTNYRNALIFAYSQANSVYEDDNIKLEIFNEELWATNKTKKTIFIDLSQCFLFHNGASMPLVSTGESDKKAKQGEKKASKVGLSDKDDVYLAIAPSMGIDQNETFICNMSIRIYGKYTTSESPSGDFTDYDKRLLETIEMLISECRPDPRAKGKFVGSVSHHFTEDESINNIGASIAYAFNKKAEDWTNVSLSTWVSDIIFAPYYVELPKDLKNKDKKGFGIKETAPATIHVKANSPYEFDEDKSPIIVCDWEGNYNKGTFDLSSTWISKKKGNIFGIIVGALFTGGISLLSPLEETVYKKSILFDGVNDNWGPLTYVSSIMQTKQSK